MIIAHTLLARARLGGDIIAQWPARGDNGAESHNPSIQGLPRRHYGRRNCSRLRHFVAPANLWAVPNRPNLDAPCDNSSHVQERFSPVCFVYSPLAEQPARRQFVGTEGHLRVGTFVGVHRF